MGLLEIASSKSVWRGIDYYKEHKIVSCDKIEEGILDAVVMGSNGENYSVHVDSVHPRKSTCNCPLAKLVSAPATENEVRSKERGIKAQVIDLKEKGMSKGELTSVLQSVGGYDALVDPNAKDEAAVVICDLNHTIVYMNPAAAKKCREKLYRVLSSG